MNKTSISYYIALITCLVFGIYYFIDAFNFKMAYGYDEVLLIWPVGRALTESPFGEFPKILISSFFSEDHLSPVNGLLSYFLYSKERDPILILSWATKLLYLAMVILTIILVNNLWKDKYKNIITLILMVFSQALFFGNLGYNIPFNLVVVIAILAIIFFIKHIESKSKRTLYLFLGLCIIGTLTYEQYFTMYPIILGLILILMYDKQAAYYNSLNTAKLYSILLFTLLPYLIMHYFAFGRLLPVSRLSIIGNGDIVKNLMIVILSFFNDLFFSVPKYIMGIKNHFIQYLTPLALLFAFSFFYFKKGLILTKYGYAFLNAFVISLFFIMYTGRYHPGLWAIPGIAGLIVTADILANFFKKVRFTEFQINVCLILFCFFLYGVNSITQPYKKMKENFRHEANASNSAYELIASPIPKIVVIRLPDAQALIQPIPFWLGNKIYNKDYGMRYSNKDHTLHMYGINIEQYENNANQKFADFQNVHVNNDAIVVFKNRNTYFTVDTDNNDRDIFKAVIIPESSMDSFDIYVPALMIGTKKKIKVELDFDKQNNNIHRILFGTKVIENFSVFENKITFEIEKYETCNTIKFELKRKDILCNLHRICVSSALPIYASSGNYTDVNSTVGKLVLKPMEDFFFKLHDMNENGLTVMGSLYRGMPDSLFEFTRFLKPNSLLEIQYWSSYSHINKKISNISFPSTTPIELK